MLNIPLIWHQKPKFPRQLQHQQVRLHTFPQTWSILSIKIQCWCTAPRRGVTETFTSSTSKKSVILFLDGDWSSFSLTPGMMELWNQWKSLTLLQTVHMQRSAAHFMSRICSDWQIILLPECNCSMQGDIHAPEKDQSWLPRQHPHPWIFVW